MKLATAKIDVVPTLNKGAMSNIQRRFKALKGFASGAGGFFMKANQSMQLFQAVLDQALAVFNQVKGLTDVADSIGDSADAWGTTVENSLAIKKVFANYGLDDKQTEKMLNKVVGLQAEGQFGEEAKNMPIEQLMAKLAPQFADEKTGLALFTKVFGARNLGMRGEMSAFNLGDMDKVKSGGKFQDQVAGVKALAKSQAKIKRLESESALNQIAISNKKGLNKAVEQGVARQEKTKQDNLLNSSYNQIVTSVKIVEGIKDTINSMSSKVITAADKVINFIDGFIKTKPNTNPGTKGSSPISNGGPVVENYMIAK